MLWWLPSRRNVGSAAWHRALEILDAFVLRWAWPQLRIGGLARPAKARYRSVGAAGLISFAIEYAPVKESIESAGIEEAFFGT